MSDERLIKASALIESIVSTPSKVVLAAPWDAEWFARLADRQEEILDLIDNQPAAEAVSVIRCAECARYDPDQEYCSAWREGTEPDAFCSYGVCKEA